MYARIREEKYPIDNVLTEDGRVKLVFSDLPIDEVDVLAVKMPEELAVCTDNGSEIYVFHGYTVATELRKNPSNQQVMLTLRMPYESEVQLKPLSDQVAAMAAAIERGLTE